MSERSYHVLAEVVIGQHWQNVLTTSDEAYANETVRQFQEDGVKVRLETSEPRRTAQRPRARRSRR